MSDKKNAFTRLLGHISVTLISFIIVGVYVSLAFNLRVFSPIAKAIDDYSFEDFYYQILGSAASQDTSNVVTIVDMTELQTRSELADLLEQVYDMKPKVLGIDIVFEGLKEDTLVDQRLAAVAHNCSSAVFAYKLLDRTDESVHSFFMSDSLTEGFVNMPRKLYGGMKRNLSIGRMHQGQLYPSFLKLVAEQYAGEEVAPLEDKEIRINFSPLHFQIVPYYVLTRHRDLIEDRIVLLGAMKEETDMHYTPLGKMAGTELLAFGVETLLKQNEVRTLPTWLLCIVSFAIVLLVVLLRKAYMTFAQNRHMLIEALMATELCIGLFVFLIIAVIVWVAFILFCVFNLSINLGYAIAAIAFIYTANNLYETIIKLINK